MYNTLQLVCEKISVFVVASCIYWCLVKKCIGIDMICFTLDIGCISMIKNIEFG